MTLHDGENWQAKGLAPPEPRTRRARLATIAERYTEEIYDSRTERQLAGVEPAFRFAAVTSTGPMDSRDAYDGNLIVAEGMHELAELLREECGEGWLAHGRAWDLDAPWHSWGNLEVSYLVEVRKSPRRTIGGHLENPAR